jgi:CheY-specific phosphatase CheX
MNVAYINPLIQATQAVFTQMVHVPLALGRPYLRPADEQPSRQYGTSGAIGLSGAVSGLIVLSLSERVALAMGSGLAGTTFPELNPDCFDALAEIVNMIAGTAKKQLPGGQVTLTMPSLLPTAKVAFPPSTPIIVIPFDTGVGRFVIQVALQRRNAGPPAR